MGIARVHQNHGPRRPVSASGGANKGWASPRPGTHGQQRDASFSAVEIQVPLGRLTGEPMGQGHLQAKGQEPGRWEEGGVMLWGWGLLNSGGWLTWGRKEALAHS